MWGVVMCVFERMSEFRVASEAWLARGSELRTCLV